MVTLRISEDLAKHIETLAAERKQTVEDFLTEVVSQNVRDTDLLSSNDALLRMAEDANRFGFSSERDDIAENSKDLLRNNFAEDIRHKSRDQENDDINSA